MADENLKQLLDLYHQLLERHNAGSLSEAEEREFSNLATKLRQKLREIKSLKPDAEGNVKVAKPKEPTSRIMKTKSGSEFMDKINSLKKPVRGEFRTTEYKRIMDKIDRLGRAVERGTISQEEGLKAIDDLFVKAAEVDPQGSLQNRIIDFDKARKEFIEKSKRAKYPIEEGFSYSLKDAKNEMKSKALQDSVRKKSGLSKYIPEKKVLEPISKVDKEFVETLAKAETEGLEKGNLKKLLSILSKKGAAKATKGLAKGLADTATLGALEATDWERAGDEPGSIGHMIESGKYSGKDLKALKEVGDYEDETGLDYTNYAKLKRLADTGEVPMDDLEKDSKLGAIKRAVASVQDEQENVLKKKLGQQPSEDIIGDESELEDEFKKKYRKSLLQDLY